MKDAVAVVIKRNERFLLIKRAKKGFSEDYWCPITGAVENSETQAQAVKREAWEEMGINVKPIKKVWECFTDDEQYLLHWWWVRLINDEIKINPDEVKDYQWVNASEMQNIGKMFKADLKFFKEIVNGIKEEDILKKIDFKKELKHLYKPSTKEVTIVDVPSMNYLMVDGEGDPNTAGEAREAIEALFPVAYALKFMVKKEKVIDYVVMPLEGLWWTDDMTEFSMENKDIWKWTYMIMQPEFVTEDMYDKALLQVEKKKNPPALSKMRFESLHEGLSVHIMHVGSFSDEGPTVQKLHNFIKENGYKFDGLIEKHHEIYLSDLRKTSPEKMKTVIRQPIK